MFDDSELTYGDLDLRSADPFLAMSQGTLGSPEPVVRALPRLLLDGEILTFDRDSNREVVFMVEVTGDDALALNEAEQALVLEAHKARNTLRWKPAGLNTPVSVFDTFRGEVQQVFSHEGEPTERRVYQLTFEALPHARSESEVTAALSLGRRLVDDGTDASLWTPAGTDEVTSVSGRLRVRATEQSYDGVSLYTVSGQVQHNDPIGLDVGRYISVVVDDPVGYLSWNVKAAATGYPIASSVATAAAGTGKTRHYFGPFPAGFVPDLVLQVNASKGSSITLPADFWLDDVYVEATLPAGSTRVQYGQVDIDGAVRTPATVTVESADGLGDVQVFVSEPRNGFSPGLAAYLTDATGTYTADATLISGGSYYTGDLTYQVPAVTLRPVAYHVVAHINYGTTTPVTHSLTAQLLTAAGAALTEVYTTAKRVAPAVTGWQLATLGTFYPPGDVNADSTNVVELTIDASTVSVDEVWLVPMDGAMLQVKAGEAKRLRIIAPDPDYPNGAVFIGTTDADERSALGKVAGSPVLPFQPGVNMLHVVTTDTDAAEVDVAYFPRWPHNAAL